MHHGGLGMDVRESRVRTLRMIWPMFTRATLPLGFPKAPRMPVCSLSAPAHDNILLMRMTWYGWARIRRWNPSFPAIFTRYLMVHLVSNFCDFGHSWESFRLLVGADTGSFKSFRGELFVLVYVLLVERLWEYMYRMTYWRRDGCR